MPKNKNYSRSNNNGLLTRLLGYALTTFIIPVIILLLKLLAYALISFVIPFVINIIRKKVAKEQPLLCNKCHGTLEVIDRNSLYCKNCKMIKIDQG